MKRKIIYLTSLIPVMARALPVLAEEGSTGTANATVVSAVQTTASDMLATGNAVVPIALTVISLGLVVNYGIRLFKKNAKP